MRRFQLLLSAFMFANCGGNASEGVVSKEPSTTPPTTSTTPATSTTPTVYATLSAKIDETISANNVRIALAWYLVTPGPAGTDEGGSVVMSSDDIPVSENSSGTVQLNVTELPPASATDQYGMATASLLLYQDTNGNGKLDFTPSSASGFADVLLGAVQGPNPYLQYSINYVDTAANAQAFGMPQGFSILETTWSATSNPPYTNLIVPIDTSLPIKTSTDPKLSCYLVVPLPDNAPTSDLQAPIDILAPQCAGNAPPAGSITSCYFYTTDQMYAAATPVATSPWVQSECGDSYTYCSIIGTPPASLGCPTP